MRGSRMIVLVVLAFMAGAAHAQSSFRPAKLDLPTIQEFLPSPDQAKLLSINQILAKSGLPQWDELGLPPLSELMKPVGAPRSVMGRLPSRADVAKMANDTLVQVVNELLPPELKALSSVRLPKLKLAQVFPKMALPPMPEKLPPLADLLKALPPLDPKAAKMALPASLAGVKLPAAGDLYKFLEQAAVLLQGMPKPANMPSLQEVMAVVNSLGSSLNGVVAAGAPKGA